MPRKIETENTTPSKPFQVVLYVHEDDGRREELVEYASEISTLNDDFNKALQQAKASTQRDGISRAVELRQVLQRTAVDAARRKQPER